MLVALRIPANTAAIKQLGDQELDRLVMRILKNGLGGKPFLRLKEFSRTDNADPPHTCQRVG